MPLIRVGLVHKVCNEISNKPFGPSRPKEKKIN